VSGAHCRAEPSVARVLAGGLRAWNRGVAVTSTCARAFARLFVTITSLRVFTLRGGGGEWRADSSRFFRSHEGNKGKKS
jgi:hypothetical protein